MTDALLDELFALIDNPASLKKRYAAEAKTREDVGLALARFEAFVEDEDADVAPAVRAEGSGALLAPLVIAHCLVEDHSYSVIRTLQRFDDTFPKAAAAGLHALLKRADENARKLRGNKKTQREGDAWAEVSIQVAASLAVIGETKIAEGLVRAHPARLAKPLLENGIGVDEAIARLARREDEDDALREAQGLMTSLADARVERAAPAIRGYLETGIFIHAFAALAKLKDEGAIEPARRLLRQAFGDAWSVDILRLSAEHLLRAFGEKPPLDLPRSAVHWPIIDYHSNEPEALVLRAMAVAALAEHGDAKDKKLAQKQLASPYRIVREAAKKAFAKPPVLLAWDPGRVAWTKKNGGTKALLEALEDPTAIFRHNIVKTLAEDAKSKAQIASFIVQAIEERMTMPYNDDIDLDVDIDAYVTVGEELASGPAKKIFAASKNPWVNVRILRADEEEPTTRAAWRVSTEVPTKKARVTRFDAPPYVFARGFSRLALAEDAERMLVIGAESLLFDPQANERLLSLGDGSDVTACAISADGSRFALARGSKIGVHDGKSGDLVSRLEAPGQVTALAFSPDGSQLACGTSADVLRVLDATNGKEAFDAKAPGAVRGVGWLGPKRAVFLADKAKKSVLVDVDVPKSKSTAVLVPLATKLVTCGKWLATAGERHAAIHDAKLAPKLEIDTDAPIVDLAIENDKTLLLRFPDSLQRAKLGGKSPKLDQVRRDGVSALAASGRRIYAAVGDTLMSFHEDKQAKVVTGVHDQHVCSITPLRDGRLVTNGWDGRILLWKPEGGIADTLVARKDRIDHIAIPPAQDRVYYGEEHNLLCLDLASRQVTVVVGGEDIEKDIAEHMPKVTQVAASSTHVAWAGSDGVHIVERERAEEVAALPIEDVEALAMDSAGHFYAGTDNGSIACFDAKGTVLWQRVEHGVDMLKGQLYGDPHRSVAYLATHGRLLASLGSDDSVRVFDGPTGERKLRGFRGAGIFNTAAFSPSGQRVAFTYDNALEVREVDSGALVCQIEDWGSEHQSSPMGVAFTDEHTVFVGMGMGGIYRVALADR